MILCDWKQNLCCYLDIFKEEGFVYFSTGISDISKMIQSCFGTLEAPRLQQEAGVKRRFLVEHVWKSCAGPPEMQPWSSSARCWWQMVRLFETMFPGLRACEVLPLHVFEVRSCFLTSCHRATSAASCLLSHTRRLLLLLRACSTVENVCVSLWQRVSTPTLTEPVGDSRMHRFYNCPYIYLTKRNEIVTSRGITNRNVLNIFTIYVRFGRCREFSDVSDVRGLIMNVGIDIQMLHLRFLTHINAKSWM